MFKKIVVLFVVVFSLTPAWAGNIQGRIIEATTKAPLEFVNVTILDKNNDKSVGGAITNHDGVFNISSVPGGTYRLRVSFVGYQTLIRNITVTAQKLELGNLLLEEDGKTLKEVEVVGQGSQMRFDIDKKVFSVDQNIAAAGGSATDVLQNIPSVEVDNQGNISLRNNESVEVWINGKPAGLTAENRAQVLQQMPAESIEAIEVMTNPSAKFNPEGTAGIINLVMKKNRKAGYYGSLSAGAMYTDGGKLGGSAGANINYSSSKIDAYANIGFRKMSMSGGGYTNRKNFNNGDTILLNQTNTSDNSFGGLFFRAGLDYHLNSKNTLGIAGFGHSGPSTGSSRVSYLFTELATNTKLKDYLRDNIEDESHGGYNINLNHKYDMDTKGSNILTNLSYSSHSRNGSSRYIQKDKLSSANNQDISQNADGSNWEIELKTDYTKKFSDNNRLELGWNSTWQDRLSVADGFNNLLNKAIPEYYNKFNYVEQIHAAYATYGNRFNNLSVQAGVRAEYLLKQVTTTSSSSTVKLDPQSYFELFPSVYVSYSLPKNNEVQLNYTRRVNRPRGRQINSFRDYSDSTNISFGNPYLLPEFASVFELNYLKNWDNHSLSTSIYYNFTDDVIQRVQYVRNNVMESTFMNLTKQQSAGMEFVAKNRLFTILNLTSSLNLYYNKINKATYTNPLEPSIVVNIPSRESFSWDARMIANLMFSKTFSAQITGRYAAPQQTAQGNRAARYSLDMGLRKTFFDKKFSLNLMARDLLNSRKMKGATWGEGFYQEFENQFHGRMVGLTLTYNFGNMNPKPQNKGQQNHSEPENDMEPGMGMQ